MIIPCVYKIRMVEDRGHGVKRKLSDRDGDLQNRCYQRQTIFNISICKLRKNYGNSEPLLSKTVLIANTIRLIEDDIEEEKRQVKQLFCGANEQAVDNFLEVGSQNLSNELQESMILQALSREVVKKPLDSVHFEKELNLLGDKLIRELGLDYCKERRDLVVEKSDRLADYNNNNDIDSDSALDFERDIVSCSSLLGLELSDELEFGDVDLSMYDFDTNGNAAMPMDLEGLCAAWGLTSANSLTRCATSIKLERSSETFDELDQVIQVLVGS